MKLPHLEKIHLKSISKLVFVVLAFVSYLGVAAFLVIRSNKVESQLAEIKKEQQNFSANFSEELFDEHLKLMGKRKIESELDSVASQLEELSNTQQGAFALTTKEIYNLYGDFQNKIKRNDDVKIDTAPSKTKAEEWGSLLINQDFENLKSQISTEIASLDAGYKKYIDSLPKVTVPAAGSGYSFLNITTERGTSHGVSLIKIPLSQVRVKTLAAIEDDCKDNCATKTLAEYVNENGGFAGMNGSYNCPPDYAACAGKTNSFDFALYDSNDEKWLNEDALSWGDTGMMTFSGHSAQMYKKTSDYDGDSVDAGISNFPSLLKNGEVVVDEGDLSAYQKTKGLRGAIGFGGENIYLAQINNATVTDTAYAMKALGAQNALNLDGGGSSALYINGGYVVGPGRRLSTAIVLIK